MNRERTRLTLGLMALPLIVAVPLLAACKADLKCGPLEVDEVRRRCVCPNGGEFRDDGLCYLDDGSVTPLDAGASGDGGMGDEAAVDAGVAQLDACVPLGAETCDGTEDEDCDGTVDEGCECTDGAERDCGTSDVGACELGSQRCVAGAWGTCEGGTEPGVEQCNDVDDDCDGDIDEDVARVTFYRDEDGDTYGSDAVTRVACRAPAGYVTRRGDCLDTNASVRPGQTEFFTTPIAGAPAGLAFDYDCDGAEEQQYVIGLACAPTASGCLGTAGYRWFGGDPSVSCGSTALYQTGCSPDCESIRTNRTQGCR